MEERQKCFSISMENFAGVLIFLFFLSCKSGSQPTSGTNLKTDKNPNPMSYKVALVDFEIGDEKYYTYSTVRDFYKKNKDSIEAANDHKIEDAFHSDSDLDKLFDNDDSTVHQNGYVIDTSDQFTYIDTTGVNFATGYSSGSLGNKLDPLENHINYEYYVSNSPDRDYTARIPFSIYSKSVLGVVRDSSLLLIDAHGNDSVNIRKIVMDLHLLQKTLVEPDPDQSHYHNPVPKPPLSSSKQRVRNKQIEKKFKKLEKELSSALFVD